MKHFGVRSANRNGDPPSLSNMIVGFCVAQSLPWASATLRRTIREYVAHYHHERTIRDLKTS
jgi:hypothetical protein